MIMARRSGAERLSLDPPESFHVRIQRRRADVPDDAGARHLGIELIACIHRHLAGALDGDFGALGLELACAEPAGPFDLDHEIIDATRQVAAGSALDQDRQLFAFELAGLYRDTALDVDAAQVLDGDLVSRPLAMKAVSCFEGEIKHTVLD